MNITIFSISSAVQKIYELQTAAKIVSWGENRVSTSIQVPASLHVLRPRPPSLPRDSVPSLSPTVPGHPSPLLSWIVPCRVQMRSSVSHCKEETLPPPHVSLTTALLRGHELRTKPVCRIWGCVCAGAFPARFRGVEASWSCLASTGKSRLGPPLLRTTATTLPWTMAVTGLLPHPTSSMQGEACHPLVLASDGT